MNPTKTLYSFAVYALMLASPLESMYASSTRSIEEANTRQNDIIITCPAQVTYQIEGIPQWHAGFHGIKRLMFEDASVSGRILACNYSANSGSVRDTSMLTREMPAGYVCKNDRIAGTKNWQFTCKRSVAPIKIKTKSD